MRQTPFPLISLAYRGDENISSSSQALFHPVCGRKRGTFSSFPLSPIGGKGGYPSLRGVTFFFLFPLMEDGSSLFLPFPSPQVCLSLSPDFFFLLFLLTTAPAPCGVLPLSATRSRGRFLSPDSFLPLLQVLFFFFFF